MADDAQKKKPAKSTGKAKRMAIKEARSAKQAKKASRAAEGESE
ncbi:hypothetical protein GCM10010116_29680 [Microbispora rosea subsp. aerata]|nr:hypothetical protein [Microbispora rosea]GGO14720.1 hypothetical protein GCM10010116_29680 [Microbispora rosea subsp. aerata]GIH55582.1 hypothetical protein Mro02_24960 [Microbispora rosea subsp. aerata]GLJ86576.1 hypothetical protein GCM10017588_53140 [Microbispora rosea subsp. aerata]